MGSGPDAFRLAPSLERALAGAAIRVGTLNPAKLGAVRSAFEPFAESGDKIQLVSVDVESGVSEQPLGWDEIVAGARNRSRTAFQSGDCALAVGIEDGLVQIGGGPSGSGSGTAPDRSALFYNVGCAWLTDGEREGHGFSSGFAYPPSCQDPAVHGQEPIGALFDALWQANRPGPPGPATIAASGRQGGNIGKLTDGRLDRSAYGAQAVICGLIRFLHSDLYDSPRMPDAR
jgi:inosine/xanthosine triphosphatase